jgi:hypothetical protein
MEHWIRTDEIEETSSALETTAEVLRRIPGDLYQWKWAILALHNTVQGFMVLALRGSHSLHVYRPEDAARWLEAHEKWGPYPTDLKLDDFLNLYKKIKGELMLKFVDSKRFVPSGTQGRSVKELNGLRNEFVHFTPKGWSLEVSGLPVICLDCLNIVEFLGWESRNLPWPDENAMARVRVALDAAREAATNLRDEYRE